MRIISNGTGQTTRFFDSNGVDISSELAVTSFSLDMKNAGSLLEATLHILPSRIDVEPKIVKLKRSVDWCRRITHYA